MFQKRKSAMAALTIAFETPDSSPQPRPSGSRPIDLVHLARQTGGDKVLETEVLALFARQARQAVAQLGVLEASSRVELAHRLAGAAKGVGAFEVARCAEAIEARPANSAAVAAFTKAVVDADNFIVGLTR
jgi:HPt (histidine-containing phosphotransfer) domain-containing protein